MTKADLPKLVYLEKAIKESMRLKPVGPVVLRRAISDDVIDGVPVPAGTNIIVNLAQMHRLGDHWEKPDDYYPDHFDNKVN